VFDILLKFMNYKLNYVCLVTITNFLGHGIDKKNFLDEASTHMILSFVACRLRFDWNGACNLSHSACFVCH